MLRIGITGATGRMGKSLIKTFIEYKNTHNNIILTAAICRPDHYLIGIDVGELVGLGKIGISLSTDINKLYNEFDILIDFTTPSVTIENIQYCCKYNKPIVIGTTGFSENEKQLFVTASQKIPIIKDTNFSIGVNLCFKLLNIIAKEIGKQVDIEIIEKHHRNKKDAPSGTALRMGEIIANTLDIDFNQLAKGLASSRSRQQKNKICFSSLRCGNIIGDHTVLFAGTGDCITLTHQSFNRRIFAEGVIRAALWIKDKKYGIYDMQDVLGLRT